MLCSLSWKHVSHILVLSVYLMFVVSFKGEFILTEPLLLTGNRFTYCFRFCFIKQLQILLTADSYFILMNLVIFHPLQLFQSKEGMELQFYTSTINWLLHKIKMCSATNNKNSTQLFFKRRDTYLINPKYRATTRLIERLNIKKTVSFNLFALPFSSY